MLSIFSLLLANALVASAEVKYGTIGMGINMYHPWCGTACSDVLSGLYLNCTTFDEEMHSHHGMVKRMSGMDHAMGTTSAECRAGDQPWLQTFSYCITTHCDAEGVPTEEQETFWQKNAAEGMPVPSLKEALPAVAPTAFVAEEAEWLNETMLANDDAWTTDRRTIEEFETTEDDHAVFSMVIMIVSVVMPAIAGFWLLFTSSTKNKSVHKIRAYFTVPALFGGRQSEPLPWKIGYVPARSTSTIIAIYVILNIIFSCVDFKSVQPNSWYSNRNQEMAAYVGNRAGVLSFANMALAMLFSTRNNPLSYVSGWTPTTFITLHRWAARVSVLQAIIHSVAYTADYVSYMDPPMFNEEAAIPYFWWGIIATITMSLMVGLSILPLRAYAYEAFLIGHIVLAILSLVGCWYHIDLRFSKNWGYEVWLYLAFAFWAYDRLVRLARLVFYSFLGGTSHGQVERIAGLEDVVALKLYPSRKFEAGPGQHTFIYFPGLGRFWENHPFTIAGWGVDGAGDEGRLESENSSLDGKASGSSKNVRVATKAVSSHQPTYLDQFYVKCLFRVHGGTTSRLHRVLATQMPSTVLCEGAYGGHSPAIRSVLGHAEHILVIAGGIGITFAAAYAQQYADEAISNTQQTMPQCSRMRLVWSVREHGLLEYARRELLPSAKEGERSLEYSFHVTGGPNEADKAGKRMNVGSTLESVMLKGKKIVVLVCGPGGLADDVRKEVVACNKRGFDIELLEESFAW